MSTTWAVTFVLVFITALADAQTPAGSIVGNVTDSSGAVLPGARLTIENRDTGLTRILAATSDGDYVAALVPPGVYLVVAEAEGFKRLERLVTVEAGTTTAVNLLLELGEQTETVTVGGAVPLLHYTDHLVGSVVTREQIETLPLNGRNFLDLAQLEPGVTSPVRGTNNRVFVSALGSGLQTIPRVGHTRVTADGANVNFTGSVGAALQVSQDAVQEFQIATTNFDPGTSLTSNGAVNIVTRSGGNEPRGTGSSLYRDHHLAAYPGLARDRTNPNPFFQRHQFGASIGGPIRKDRAFAFISYERNDQRAVVSVQPGGGFAGLGGIFPSPYAGHQFSARVDGRPSRHVTAFARYTRDFNRGFGPPNDRVDILPSGWARRLNDVHQSVIGLTNILSSRVVNDLRVSSFFVDSREEPPDSSDCPRPCVGLGAARILIPDAGLTLGKARTLLVTGHRYQFSDNLAWHHGRHSVRFGFDWEHSRVSVFNLNRDPAQLTLWAPDRVRQLAPGLPLPSSLASLEDILQLPLQAFLTGVGPATNLQRDFRPHGVFDLYRLFGTDTWRIRRRLAVSYGLAWSYEPNVLNHDLTKPALLIPLLGMDGLNPPAAQKDRFSPMVGFAWTADADGTMVVRGGAGRYFDPMSSTNQEALSNERLYLSPLGTGRLNVAGTNIPCNGRIVDPRAPTSLTGAELLSCIGGIQADLSRGLDSNNRDFSVRNINRTKQGTNLHDPSYETPHAVHVSLGVQRQIANDFAVSADLVWRRFTHTFVQGIDYNHWLPRQGNIPPRAVIPPCTSDEPRLDDNAICSNGPITFDTTIGRQRYTGLLVRADKRLSRGTQFRLSYALGSYLGSNGTGPGSGFNNDNWLENYGPLPTDLRHVLSASGFVELPWQIQLAVNVSAQSRPPFSVFVEGADFNGDGTPGDLLPGTRVNQFGRGFDEDDLVRILDRYNSQAAVTFELPERFSFNDSFFTQDLRLTRTLRLGRANVRLQLLGEVFNLLNTANLVEYSGNLANKAAFGQPRARFNQVFGSGGPRAFQLGAKLSF